jgi:aspartyl-tRNA(Asn)/glutamyl-tRNA(Gln) amidotransferase subunit A
MGSFSSSAVRLRDDLVAGRISSVEATKACLDRIEQVDGRVKAFLQVDSEGALAAAADIDRRRSQGLPVGLLAGVPIALKDILCTRGQPTTCGSKMLERFVPPYDATVVRKLREADAVILGKVNLDEFAMGGSTENSAFFPTRNPWDLERVPGGSSGGSAACVAAGMAPWSIGTDTGGSIRQPAALCGITGLKPTYGRVSRYGLVAFASSLDQAGPMTHSAEDAALLLEAIAGHDPLDATSADVPTPKYTAELDKPLEGLRLGLVRDHYGEGLSSEVEAAVREAVRIFESLGARTVDISLPHSKYGIATYYVIAPCEASSNLARYDGVHFGYRTDEPSMLAELEAERRAALAASGKPTGSNSTGAEAALAAIDSPLVRLYRRTRAEGFGPEVKRRVMLGTYALSAGYYDAYYLKALKVRRLIRNDYDAAFEHVDLIIGPTTPAAAYRLGEKSNDPLSMYLEDLYTVTANLAGVPGISIPCGATASGLPIGLQLQAPAFQESRLLRAAHRFQRVTDWHLRRPDLP